MAAECAPITFPSAGRIRLGSARRLPIPVVESRREPFIKSMIE